MIYVREVKSSTILCCIICIKSTFILLNVLPSGDVLGPGMTSSFMNSLALMDLILGDADTYLFEVGYNLYTLKYLKTTNQMSSINLESALENLNTGEY